MAAAYQQLGISVTPNTGPGFWEHNKGRAIGLFSSLGLVVTSAIFLSKEKKSEAERIAACAGIGIGVQGMWESLAPLGLRRKVQKVMTNLTLPAMFTLTQVYYNKQNPEVQKQCVNTILGLGGAMAAQMISRDLENGVQILTESSAESRAGETVIGPPFFSFKAVVFRRLAMSAALSGFWYVYKGDSFVDSYSSFFVPFFVANTAGAAASHLLHKKIRHLDVSQPLLDQGEIRRTRWRWVLLAVDMCGKALPFCFLLPIQTKAGAIGAGTLMGTVDGLTERSQQERLGNVPIDQAEELQPDPNVPDLRYLKHAWTAAMVAGFSGFFGWQEHDRLNTEADQRALAILYGTGLVAFALRRVGDLYWNAEIRSPLHDGAMRSFILAPRTPLLLYFVGSNALNMSSQALSENSDLSYQLAADLAWAGYGTQLGLETAGALSARQGSPFDYPLMPFVMAVLTGKAVLK